MEDSGDWMEAAGIIDEREFEQRFEAASLRFVGGDTYSGAWRAVAGGFCATTCRFLTRRPTVVQVARQIRNWTVRLSTHATKSRLLRNEAESPGDRLRGKCG